MCHISVLFPPALLLTLVIKLVHHRRRESRESCLLLAAQSRRAVNTGPLAPVRILFAPGLDGLCHANQRRVSVNDVGFSITTHTVLCCLELRVYGVTQNLLPPACSSWSPHLKCKLKAPLVKQDRCTIDPQAFVAPPPHAGGRGQTGETQGRGAWLKWGRESGWGNTNVPHSWTPLPPPTQLLKLHNRREAITAGREGAYFASHMPEMETLFHLHPEAALHLDWVNSKAHLAEDEPAE